MRRPETECNSGSSTFVRGEECLQAWKPRGISLIEDFYRLLQTEKALADLATTQAVLAAIPPEKLRAPQRGHDEQGRLWDALQLWKKRFGTDQEVSLACLLGLLIMTDHSFL